MRFRRLCAVCALAAATVTVPAVAATPASAAGTASETAVIGFAVSPATISYGDRDVTVSGQLVENDDHGVSLPGEQVVVESDGTILATLPTGTAGDFSGTVRLPAPTTLVAFGYDAETGRLTGQASSPVRVTATISPTRVTLNSQSASQVWAGTTLTFTGTAQIQLTDGTWVPLPGGAVRLNNGVGETTASDGTFSLTTEANGSLYWQAELLPNSEFGGDAFYGYTYSNTDTMTTRYRTRLLRFHVASQMEAHHVYWTTGTAQIWNGSSWTGFFGLDVDIDYRYQGSATWHSGMAQTSGSGYFSGPRQVGPGTVYWKAWVPYQSAGNDYASSAAIDATSRVTDQTCTAITPEHSAGRTVLGGWVRDWCRNGQETFGDVRGKTVKLYYRHGTSGTWSYLGAARTGSGGIFTLTAYRTLSGYFRAVFPAQGYYLGSTSATRHLG
jgi:hypothetical protein